MLLGNIASDNPNANIQYGSRVRLGYYDQELKGVNPDNTLIEEMISLVGITQAHNMLGQFMFPYDAQYKKIRDLSGGEKARLALLKLTLGEYNFLVLDEPTNHLDVEMIEALENALMAYTGTLFIVSHDRRFIDKVTNTIWEIDKQELIQYDGDWGYYQFLQNKKQEQEKELEKSQKQIIVEKPKPKNKISKWQAKQDIVQVEASIEALETELEQIQHKLTGADGISPEEIIEASKRYPSLEQELLNAMETWDQLSEIIGDG